MEYIHKAKAEKNRTKILSDQMEARRMKNKVCIPLFRLLAVDSLCLQATRERRAQRLAAKREGITAAEQGEAQE